MANKFKNHVATNKTVSLNATGTLTQDEVIVPAYNSDVESIEVVLTAVIAGTPVTPTTISKCINALNIKSKDGLQILQSIGGTDIPFLCRVRNIGRTVTDTAVATNSTISQAFRIPLNIEKADQDTRLQVVLGSLADLAASGLDSVSVTYKIVYWYYDQTANVKTEKIQKISLPSVVGNNTYGINIPNSIAINNVLFVVGSEALFSTLRFTADGQKEMDDVTLPMLAGQEDALTVSGHVTGQFRLFNAPFVSSTSTELNVVGITSASTFTMYLIGDLRL